jgi:hypothetical protein
MKIIELNQKPALDTSAKLKDAYLQLESLLVELRTKELPESLVISINKDIEELNANAGSEKELRKIVKRKQKRMIESLERELKLVPKNYYRNLWVAVGMAAFGLPIGVAFGAGFGNMAFLGIGLPIGLAIGAAVGARMDKKAFEEGRQLDLDIN